MTEGKIEAFLNLFCINDSRYVSIIEPSWQSWMVLCLCIVVTIATASSGAYFHRSNAVQSSVICFIVSVVGFVMAAVTFIAILMGCKRRRKCTAHMRNGEGFAVYTNPEISEQCTVIQIEPEGLGTSNTANQLWMNPVYTEYEKPLYEADWNMQKGLGKFFEKDETDFDKRDSDYFYNSSDTLTDSYRSYSEDEGYFPNSSNENNVKKTGKHCLKRLQDYRLQETWETGKASEIVQKRMAMDTLVNARKKLLITLQNSKRSSYAHEKHSDGVCLTRSSESRKDSAISISVENDGLPEFVDSNSPTRNVLQCKKSISSGQLAEFPEDFTKPAISYTNSLPTVVNIESDSQFKHCEIALPAITPHNIHSIEDGSTYLVPPNQNILSDKQTQQSRKKLELPVEFPSLPYPIQSKKSSNSQRKNQRRSSRGSDDVLIPIYEKRPLLDVNGAPLSQKELVKELTRQLRNGLQKELPISPTELDIEQNFQLDIESLRPISS